MNITDHARARMVERKITPGMVGETIKNATVRYKCHREGDAIAFERAGVRVIVDPHTVTVITAMWIK